MNINIGFTGTAVQYDASSDPELLSVDDKFYDYFRVRASEIGAHPEVLNELDEGKFRPNGEAIYGVEETPDTAPLLIVNPSTWIHFRQAMSYFLARETWETVVKDAPDKYRTTLPFWPLLSTPSGYGVIGPHATRGLSADFHAMLPARGEVHELQAFLNGYMPGVDISSLYFQLQNAVWDTARRGGLIFFL